MSFLYPWVIWFSSLITIPIIIHLFYFRRYKVVLFSNNALLDNVIKQSKSQQRIRNLIILLLRILFILSLVLAFAQPFIPNNEKTISESNNILAIYIDNSFSMTQEGEKTSILDEAKSKAIAMLQSMPSNTKCLLCYHGMDFSVSRLFSSEQAQKKINEIKPSAAVLTWSDVFELFEKAKTTLSINSPLNYAFFTDGQKYAVDYNKWKKQNGKMLLFYAKGASISNLSIDSVWAEHPNHIVGKNEKLTAKIRNYGNDDLYKIPIRMFINDTLKSVALLNIKSQSSENIDFNFTNFQAGWNEGKIEISDFPVIFDNNLYFTYPVYSLLKVAVVGNNNVQFLKAFFDSDSSIQATYFPNENIAYSRLNSFQVVVLNQIKEINSGLCNSLKTFVSKGGTVIIIPNNDWVPEAVNTFFYDLGWIYLKQDTAQLTMQIPSYEQDFFFDMFTKKEEHVKMPWGKNSLTPEIKTKNRADKLLQFENGKNAALRIFFEKGQWYVFGFSIDPKSSNILSHPLFVAMMHRIIQLAVPTSSLYYTIAQNTTIHVALDSVVSEKGLQLTHTKSKQSFIPMQQNLFNECVISLKEAQVEDGIYHVLSDNQKISNIALNYNRKESEMTFYSANELSQFLKQKNINTTVISTTNSDEVKATVYSQNHGLRLWKWFVLSAFLFLIMEMVFIRLWKI
ncbi:MAG: BatA domain-containing protein [Bacteroidales bacterium]